MAEIELLHDLRDRYWTPEQWLTAPVSFNKRGEQHYYSLVFNDDAIRLCNECSGEIDCA